MEPARDARMELARYLHGARAVPWPSTRSGLLVASIPSVIQQFPASMGSAPRWRSYAWPMRLGCMGYDDRIVGGERGAFFGRHHRARIGGRRVRGGVRACAAQGVVRRLRFGGRLHGALQFEHQEELPGHEGRRRCGAGARAKCKVIKRTRFIFSFLGTVE